MGVGGSGAPPLTGQQCIDRIISVADYADQLGIGGSSSRRFFVMVPSYDLSSIDTDQVTLTGLPDVCQLVGVRAVGATADTSGATISACDTAALGGILLLSDATFGGIAIAQEAHIMTLEALADVYVIINGTLYISTTANTVAAVNLLFEFMDLTP